MVCRGWCGVVEGVAGWDAIAAAISGHVALAVKGNAVIDGTLECTLAPGIMPQPGDRFILLVADSVTGRFSNVERMIEIAGQSFRILYTADTVELEKISDATQ